MVEGESKVEAGAVSVGIPKAVAEALGISEGDTVDVDFFENPTEMDETYGEMPFIAITRI